MCACVPSCLAPTCHQEATSKDWSVPNSGAKRSTRCSGGKIGGTWICVMTSAEVNRLEPSLESSWIPLGEDLKKCSGQRWIKYATHSTRQQLTSVFHLGQGTSQIISRRVTLWHKSSAKNCGLCSSEGMVGFLNLCCRLIQHDSSFKALENPTSSLPWFWPQAANPFTFELHHTMRCFAWEQPIGDETSREQPFPNGTDRTSLNWFAAWWRKG